MNKKTQYKTWNFESANTKQDKPTKQKNNILEAMAKRLPD